MKIRIISEKYLKSIYFNNVNNNINNDNEYILEIKSHYITLVQRNKKEKTKQVIYCYKKQNKEWLDSNKYDDYIFISKHFEK